MTDRLTPNARYRELKDVGQLTSTCASIELVEGEARKCRGFWSVRACKKRGATKMGLSH
jgi:hypothetical protein